MNRFFMKMRTNVLRTALGRKLRYMKQIASFTEAGAAKTVDENFPGISPEERAALIKDMLNEGKKYNVCYEEYVMYRFKDRPFEERRLFIPTRERALYCERLNDPKNQMIFDDKGKTFEVFKKFYKRDLAEVVGWTKESIEQLRGFVEKHSRFIIKPFNGGNGRGIQIIDAEKYDSFESLCAFLKNEYPQGFVAEELIRQCKELSAVHAASVNTMRIFTVIFDDRIEFLPLVWRVGRGGSCVDNGGSGGIFCVLDDNGVIVSTCDEKGRSYDVHPDTNHPLVGFQIPRIEEAKAFAKELAMVVPSNRYCGWDIALTDDGWVMQEGNWQGGIVAFQCPMQRGYRKEMDAIMKELGL
jgi:hypothetical protein